MRLLALKVTGTSYAVAWSRTISMPGSKPDSNPPLLEHGQMYLLDANNNILAFATSTGKPGQSYHPHVTGSIGSFAFVFAQAG